MKIGIVTYWDSQDNYGQLLQCFALQYYLRAHGHNVFLIRYKSHKPPKSLWLQIIKIPNFLSLSYIKAYIKYLQTRKDLIKYQACIRPDSRGFDTFRKDYLNISERIYTIEDLRQEKWDIEALICGSDQIWGGPSYDRPCYYLDFGPKSIRRIAYAVSFGREILDKQHRRELPKLIKPFKAISVREDAGIVNCKMAGRDDACLVCDPTLLLDRNTYVQALHLSTKPSESLHLFCYLINWETLLPQEEIYSFAQSRRLDIRLFTAHGSRWNQFYKTYPDLSISSWLESISSAKAICTNSFHGTVFSILMHRPFITFPLIGSAKAMNVRIVSFLEKLGLENRIYRNDSSFAWMMEQPIDWEVVDQKLNKLKEDSFDFLTEALKV